MPFRWQELAVDSRHSIASRTSTPLSRPVTVTHTLSGHEPHYRPAGRVERTPEFVSAGPITVANPADGEALAASLQFLMSAANDFSLQQAISDEFRRANPMVQRIMLRHRTGGLLAVASVLVSWDTAQAMGPADPTGRPPAMYFGSLSRQLGTMNVGTVVYAEPVHAYAVWRHADVLDVAPAPSGQYLEHRFFWGAWE
jgi:hypothetical protein